MKQYNDIKSKYPDTILLFRVGDFYETFGEDAILASKILGIVLTKRGAGSSSEVELAGFPHHSIENYLPKLVRAGNRVAVCDQLEDPKLTTFFSVLNTLDTSGLLNLQISTGILTTSVDPSSNVISIINGITSPPMFLNFIL